MAFKSNDLNRYGSWVGLLLACCLIVSPLVVQAGPSLYQATVPVSGQGQAERKQAIRQALEQVVVKLSGQRNSLNNAGLQAALSGSINAVEQFQYVQEGKQNFLSVSFQAPVLDSLLLRYSIPVWGGARPEVMVWLAIDNGQQRFLAQPDVHYVSRSLQRAADNRGIPVLLPMMDLEDRRAIAFNDVWGDFGDRIDDASRRYGANHVLSVRILKLAGGQWSARWSLTHRKQSTRWQNRSTTLNGAIEEGFNKIAEHLAEQYRPRLSDQAQAYTLLVSKLNDVRVFARVATYLESMDRVENIRWDRFEEGQAWFQLVYLGDTDDFKQALSLGRVLYPSPVSSSFIAEQPASVVPLLRYQPQP